MLLKQILEFYIQLIYIQLILHTTQSKSTWVFKSHHGQLAHPRHKSAYFQRDTVILVNSPKKNIPLR